MNTLKYKGKTYIAKEEGALCNGCAFFEAHEECPAILGMEIAHCCADDRYDGRNIIWVETNKT